MLYRFLAVCAAGALGTGVRYLVALWANKTFGSGFPYGTLLVNLAGCFLIAVVLQAATSSATISPTLRIAAASGFLGGLTTYSSFNYETTVLIEQRATSTALLSFFITTIGCLAAGALGLFVARRLIGT
ncbi:MAG: fluoride efflux transporter CrcB [Myxococcales bacterium]|nr:fluoride efflux transporter CrcB [Myxococcales bacterium]